MSRVGRLVDVRRLVVAGLAERLPDVRVLTRLPVDLGTGSYVWVPADLGGPTNGENAQPSVDVSCLVPGGEGEAFELMQLAHAAVGALGGQTVDGQPIHEVRCVSLPVGMFWSDAFDRMVGTYELDLPVYD